VRSRRRFGGHGRGLCSAFGRGEPVVWVALCRSISAPGWTPERLPAGSSTSETWRSPTRCSTAGACIPAATGTTIRSPRCARRRCLRGPLGWRCLMSTVWRPATPKRSSTSDSWTCAWPDPEVWLASGAPLSDAPCSTAGWSELLVVAVDAPPHPARTGRARARPERSAGSCIVACGGGDAPPPGPSEYCHAAPCCWLRWRCGCSDSESSDLSLAPSEGWTPGHHPPHRQHRGAEGRHTETPPDSVRLPERCR
jgi:hypothetical protein